MLGKTSKKTNKKVMIALSGGIDSAVSAVLLMEAGYEVEAAFMKNWSSTTGLIQNECPWLEDRREALKVAAHLGIPMHTFDFEKEYTERVMEYFFKEYSAGRTPNPDVMCNKEIKFKLLYDKAMDMGFDYLATGHYAQIKNGTLLRSKDEFKDQTYFIYNLKKEQLDHILFPVGGMKKKKVRALAHKHELPNADRKESMGICFVGKIQLDTFLKQRIPEKVGNIVDAQSGQVVGSHKGIAYYTLGQREGLRIGGTAPYYVVRKDMRNNTLLVSHDPDDQEFQVSTIGLTSINWLVEPKAFPFTCKARFRHQQELIDVTVNTRVENQRTVSFMIPQKAVASGQSIVFYDGRICLGGAVIA